MQTEKRIQPTSISYIIFLGACTQEANVELAFQIFHLVQHKLIECTEGLWSALISTFAKCGRLTEAQKAFTEACVRQDATVTVYTSMIAAYGIHGLGDDALLLFQQLLCTGMQLDSVTFVSLLNACSHAGLADAAVRIARDMEEKYQVKPSIEHYVCVVDALGRVGKLKEAEQFIYQTQSQNSEIIWTTLLGACRTYRNIELAKIAGDKLLQINPNCAPTVYVLLSNIYGMLQMWPEQASIRQLMVSKGIKKIPGISKIYINGVSHTFYAGDHGHPSIKEVKDKLYQLGVELKNAGYTPDLSWVTQHFETDEEKEKNICEHSEKLAISFGLLYTSPETPLLILKNLRVCGDCHTATKFIAKHTRRHIMVRDANRFHHFSPDGLCSCKDKF